MPTQRVLDPRHTESALESDQSQPSLLPSKVREFGFIPDFDDWLPGDLVLVSRLRRNLIERQVVKTQARLGHARVDAQWHHAAVYVGDRYLCEARPGGVRYRPVVESVDRNTLLRIRRNIDLTDSERFRVAIRALMRLSQAYSYASVVGAFFRPLSPKRFVLSLSAHKRALICSQLFHDAYAEVTASILVDRLDRAVVPAELGATTRLDDVEVHWKHLG